LAATDDFVLECIVENVAFFVNKIIAFGIFSQTELAAR